MRAPAERSADRLRGRHASTAGAVTILDRIALHIGAGRADGADRPERLGQDHAAAPGDGAGGAVARAHHLGRARKTSPPLGARSCSSARRCCGAAPARNIRYALRAAGIPRAEHAQPHRRTARTGRASDSLPTAPRAGCRAASSSGWRWRARSRAIRRCCSSTSRPRASIPPPPRRSRTSSAPSAQRGIKVVMATHDLGEARRLAGDIVMLHRGRVVETGAGSVVLQRAANRRGEDVPCRRTCSI